MLHEDNNGLRLSFCKTFQECGDWEPWVTAVLAKIASALLDANRSDV